MHIQEIMEYEYAPHMVHNYLKKEAIDGDLEPEILKVVDKIEAYLDEDHDYEYMVATGEVRVREDLKEAHEALKKVNLTNIVWKLFTSISASTTPMTQQQVVGCCFNYFKGMSKPSRQLLAIKYILEPLSTCPLLNVSITKGQTIMWECALNLSEKGRQEIRKRSYVLPSITPLRKVTNNHELGYRTIKESVFCGNPLKHHDKHVNLAHINRKNSVAYTFEERLYKYYEPKFNNEPKINKNGMLETPMEVQARKEAWLQLHEELPHKAAIMVKYGNKFYIPHRYDMRLRTYAKAHHFNYLGTSWLKAAIQLHKKEYVVGEW